VSTIVVDEGDNSVVGINVASLPGAPQTVVVSTAVRIPGDATAVDTNLTPIPGKRVLIVFDANGDVDDIVLGDAS
jgi:hypothetical protein